MTTALGFQANALDAYDADHLVVVGDAGKIYYAGLSLGGLYGTLFHAVDDVVR